MAFYGERFRRKDEEDIWEELRQMLLNPPSEQEIALKKQQEQSMVDATLEKMFPTETKLVQEKEPYLKYEDLFEDPNEAAQITGFAAPQNRVMSQFPINEKRTVLKNGFDRPQQGFENVLNNNNPLEGFGQNVFGGVPKKLGNNEFPNFEKATQKSLNNNPKQNNTNLKADLTWQEKAIDNILKDENFIKKAYPISSDMYVDARTDFSRAKANKNATVLENMNSLDSKTQEALKKYGVKSNERGVYYNPDSDVSKKFGKSEELKNAFDKNYQDIKDGNFKGEDLNFDATPLDAIKNKDKFDRYSSIQHAKLYDAYIDEQGHKRVKIGDDYDFNKRPDTLKNLPNNHGYNLQEKGALENFFTVMDVIIEDEEEKEKLLNKLLKKFQH